MNKLDWQRPDEEMSGKQTSCPKCNLEFMTMLHPFCTHKECPVRDFVHKDDLPILPRPTYEQLDRIATELQVTCDKQSKKIAYLLDRMKLIIGEPINAEFIAEQALNEFLGE